MAVVQNWNGGHSCQTDVSAKEKFDAAVRVVQSIPRNGRNLLIFELRVVKGIKSVYLLISTFGS